MNLKNAFRAIVYGKKASSEKYIRYLKSLGIKIGEDCIIYAPTKTYVDIQYPWMITIGNHVRITEGVKILTHDYSWSVLKIYSGRILGASGRVSIGNNVFIGMNSIITRNVTISDNVIIGAGSVVTKDCEADSVYAGNPAKKIMTVKQFYEKRLNAQIIEAKQLALGYYERFGKIPAQEKFHEYFTLFSDVETISKNKIFSDKLSLCNNRQQSIEVLNTIRAPFKNYRDFIQYCFRES